MIPPQLNAPDFADFPWEDKWWTGSEGRGVGGRFGERTVDGI